MTATQMPSGVTRTSQLGRSGVEVTQLGFGSGPLGGLFAPLDDGTAGRALVDS